MNPRKKTILEEENDAAPVAAPAAEPRPGDPAWQREFLARHRLKQARIPARFLNKTLENFRARDRERRELLKNAQSYVKAFTLKNDNKNGLLLSGEVGCGKTHVAVGVLREIIMKGYSGMYYNSPDLLRDIRATFDRSSETTEDDLLEMVTSIDLLVFDDVGAERMTEFVLDRFYLIVNERYENAKPVIVTTNLNEATLEEHLGPRIVSRLSEMCGKLGQFPDEDWRKKHMR